MRIGTRGSALALWQANHVKSLLEPVLGAIELVIIKTAGDRNQRDPLSKIGAAAGGKGLFVKEIEEALLDRRVSLAVHSSKDLPAELPDGLVLAAFPEREDPRDALLSKSGSTLEDLPRGAVVGTSSLRRVAQIKAIRPDLVCADIRGNVDTRIRKLDEGTYDAIVLAVSGLKRLGFAHRISGYLGPPAMVPAVGQGALAVEMREDDPVRAKVASVLDHPDTRSAVESERAFLGTMDGGCTIPVAAHARIDRASVASEERERAGSGPMPKAEGGGPGAKPLETMRADQARIEGGRLSIEGLIASPDQGRIVRGTEDGAVADAAVLGRRLAERLLAQGGREILAAIRGG